MGPEVPQIPYQNTDPDGDCYFTIEIGPIIFPPCFPFCGGGDYISPESDRRLKENIYSLSSSLDKIKQLEGVSFNWKKNGRVDLGFIAQDVEKIFPELVHTNSVTSIKTLEYANLTAPIVEAIKEQQKQIDEQKKLIEELYKKLGL